MMALLPVPLLLVMFAVVSNSAAVTLSMSGIVPPVFSPMEADGNLNLAIIPRYARFLKSYGVDGILVSGTSGEGVKLTVNEKKRLLDAWLREARALNLTIMSQVGGIPLPDAKELARYSERIKVDAILTLPELFFKPNSVRELVYFMQCIASAAPNTPVLYYHVPTYTNVEVDMVRFLDQATELIPNFKGLKVDEFDVALQLRTKVKDDQKLFFANSTYIAPAALMGFKNYIMTELNIFPELMINIIRYSQNCELRKARGYYEELQSFNSAIQAQGRSGLPPYKETMRLVTGIDVGRVRKPEIPLTERETRELEGSLRSRGIKLRTCED